MVCDFMWLFVKKQVMTKIPPRDEWLPEIVAVYFPLINKSVIPVRGRPFLKDYIKNAKVPIMHWDLNWFSLNYSLF